MQYKEVTVLCREAAYKANNRNAVFKSYIGDMSKLLWALGWGGLPRREKVRFRKERQNSRALKDELRVCLAVKKGYFRNRNHMGKSVATCSCTTYSTNF